MHANLLSANKKQLGVHALTHATNNLTELWSTNETRATFKDAKELTVLTNESRRKHKHSVEYIKQFLHREFNIQKEEDCYSLTREAIVAKNGGTLIRRYNGSLIQLLTAAFPSYPWKQWLFSKVEKNYWMSHENIKDFLQREFDIKKEEDCYKLTCEAIIYKGGSGLPRRYNFSIFNMLKAVYPNYPWKLWLFNRTGNEYWDSEQNIKNFLKQEFNIEKEEDCYKLTYRAIVSKGGKGLMHKFNGALIQMLKYVYPSYPWKQWLFSKVERGYWMTQQNIRDSRSYFDDIIKSYNITSIEDLLKKSPLFFVSNSAPHLRHKSTIGQVLQHSFPEHNWFDLIIDSDALSIGEASLRKALKVLFPNFSPLLNYRHPSLISKTSNLPMELDIYYEQQKVAFEYQGQQHYYAANAGFKRQQARDLEKDKGCQQQNITLIQVPFWWHGDITSLAATIMKNRPDLELALPTLTIPPGPPISETDPQVTNKMQKFEKNPAACFIKVKKYNEFINPTNMIMTEKYDGVRAIWTGTVFTLKYVQSQKLLLLSPPSWMKVQLPHDTILDGELWCGHQSFTRLNSILSQKYINEFDWKQIQYMVFDTPDPKYCEKPYMERFVEISNKLKELADSITSDAPQNVHLTSPFKCLNIQHMNSFFESIVSSGGEGIVLRDPENPYKPSYKMWKKQDCSFGFAKILEKGDTYFNCINEFGVVFTLPVLQHHMDLLAGMKTAEKGAVLIYGFYGISSDLLPIAGFIKKVLPSVQSWNEMTIYNIKVQTKYSGCWACRSTIPVNALCIKVNAIYYEQVDGGGKTQRIIPVSFCLSKDCLTVLQQKQQKQYNIKNKYHFPTFQNVLGAPRAKDTKNFPTNKDW